MKDHLGKELVMKGHFNEQSFDNQKKLIEKLKKSAENPELLPYVQNIVRIREIITVKPN